MDLLFPDALDLVLLLISDETFLDESKDMLRRGLSTIFGISSGFGGTVLIVTISAWLPVESDTGLKVTFETVGVSEPGVVMVNVKVG